MCLIRPCCDRISGSVFCNDRCLCLKTSSVKTMIRCCSGHGIKSSFIKLVMRILHIIAAGVSCCINALCSPVLRPGKSSIHILILTGQLIGIRKYLYLICFCAVRKRIWFSCSIFDFSIIGCLILLDIFCCFFCHIDRINIPVCYILNCFFRTKILSISRLLICLRNNCRIKFRCHYCCRKRCCCHCKAQDAGSCFFQ